MLGFVAVVLASRQLLCFFLVSLDCVGILCLYMPYMGVKLAHAVSVYVCCMFVVCLLCLLYVVFMCFT